MRKVIHRTGKLPCSGTFLLAIIIFLFLSLAGNAKAESDVMSSKDSLTEGLKKKGIERMIRVLKLINTAYYKEINSEALLRVARKSYAEFANSTFEEIEEVTTEELFNTTVNYEKAPAEMSAYYDLVMRSQLPLGRTEIEASDYVIKQMVESLQDGSQYLNYYDPADIPGSVGISVSDTDDGLFVIDSIEKYPAFQTGIERGDILLEINGVKLKGVKFMDKHQLLLGTINSRISLLVRKKDGTIMLLNLLREKIEVDKVVESSIVAKGIGYIRVRDFSQQEIGKEVASQYQELEQKNRGKLSGIIVDLRANSGGILKEEVDFADLFLSEGVIVRTQGRVSSMNQSYNAKANTQFPSIEGTSENSRNEENQVIPECFYREAMHRTSIDAFGGDCFRVISGSALELIVLVDRYTSSGAELIAAALQDHHRGLILGTGTAAKSTGGTVIPLENKEFLILTTFTMFRSNNELIQGKGVTPDYCYKNGMLVKGAALCEKEFIPVLPPDEDPLIQEAVKLFR